MSNQTQTYSAENEALRTFQAKGRKPMKKMEIGGITTVWKRIFSGKNGEWQWGEAFFGKRKNPMGIRRERLGVGMGKRTGTGPPRGGGGSKKPSGGTEKAFVMSKPAG